MLDKILNALIFGLTAVSIVAGLKLYSTSNAPAPSIVRPIKLETPVVAFITTKQPPPLMHVPPKTQEPVAPPPVPATSPQPVQEPQSKVIEEKKPSVTCSTDRMSVRLGFKTKWHQHVIFPVKGKFVIESHYLNTKDSSHVRKDAYDSIEEHLKISCELYNKRVEKVDCKKMYNTKYVKQWTPAEGGHIGTGSIAQDYQQKYLSPWMEMWMTTMMWKTGKDRPKPGEKFLIINPLNHKKVVVQMGFETGPSNGKWIGGMVAEVGYYLRADERSVLKVYHLMNQDIQLGPTDCEVK
jgi:hypothetical protein